jgi:6-phosphofructokinase 1
MDNGETMRLPPFTLHRLPTLADHHGGEHASAIPNPIARYCPSPSFFISDTDVILLDAAYHRAAPRRKIVFDPARVRAAIVTCGGLCPRTNTVVRELVVGTGTAWWT